MAGGNGGDLPVFQAFFDFCTVFTKFFEKILFLAF